MNFWDRVEKEIDRQKTTFRWLAQVLGKPETTVSGWKNKSVLPRVDDGLMIAEKLGVSVKYLVTGTDPLVDSWIVENRPMLDQLKTLPPYDLAVIRTVVNAHWEQSRPNPTSELSNRLS